jgi:hypothetical protein
MHINKLALDVIVTSHLICEIIQSLFLFENGCGDQACLSDRSRWITGSEIVIHGGYGT